jgi:hypothetical protein
MKILHGNKTFLSALFCFLAIASLSLTAPTTVFAADDTAGDKPDRWYLALGAGRTTNIDQTDQTLGGIATGKFDHKDEQIIKFAIGVTLFKYFAFEVGIINFDTLSSRYVGTVDFGAGGVAGNYSTKENINGVTATVIWHIPFYKKGSKVVTFFVKGGAFRWENKLKMKDGLGATLTRKTDDVDPTASFGIQVRGEGHSAFRFEIQRIEIDDKEINSAMINIVYYY